MSPSHAASTALPELFAASATARAASAGSVTATGEYMASTASTFGSASAAAVASKKRCAGASPMMSIGLQRDHCAGSFWFSEEMVSGARQASTTPFSAALSAAITPGPPPLVTIARRPPCGNLLAESTRAAAKSCVYVWTRTLPPRRSAASKTASSPTRAPVWRYAAFEPPA